MSLRISASGNPVPKITCSLQSKIQGNGGRILVSNEKLEMRNVRFLDQGKIECLAENVFGTQVARVKLIVFGEYVFFNIFGSVCLAFDQLGILVSFLT